MHLRCDVRLGTTAKKASAGPGSMGSIRAKAKAKERCAAGMMPKKCNVGGHDAAKDHAQKGFSLIQTAPPRSVASSCQIQAPLQPY